MKQKKSLQNPFDFGSIFALIQKFFSGQPLDLMNRQVQLKLYDRLLILAIYFLALPLLSSTVLYLTLDSVNFNAFLPFFNVSYGRVFKTIFGMQLMTSIFYFALWSGLEYVMKGAIHWNELLGQFTKILFPIIFSSMLAIIIALLSSSISFILFLAGLLAAMLLTLMSYDEPSARLQLANYWIFLIFLLAVFIVVIPMSGAFIFS